ncbi:hypothetical protein JCM10908_006199 [Rhodotorula pacifica]|uniref:F-box protein n=1 Tax=Rhodotorula pacifica TaxID=1495444 RepID=UPI00316E9C50
MSERTKYARKAAPRVSYAPESDSSDGSGVEQDDDDMLLKAKQVRRRRKKSKKAAEVESDGDEASDESETPKQPRKKRAKKSAKSKKSKQQSAQKTKKKKNGGQLERMKTLPVELFGEICSHLTPVDLLSLQRVNKQFYRLVSAKSFLPVWIASRRRLKLPDVEGITEPQYAAFVFGKACQGCGGKKVVDQHREYHLRRILCKACRQRRIVRITKLDRDQPELYAKLHPLTLQAVNCTAYGPSSTHKRWSYHEEQEYADVVDLLSTDVFLRDLDDQDLDSDIAAGRDDQSGSAEARTAHVRSRRGRDTVKKGSYRDASDSEDDAAIPASRRALVWLKSRAKTKATLLENSRKFYDAHQMANEALSKSGWHKPFSHIILEAGKPPSQPMPSYRRQKLIERRLREEDKTLSWNVFHTLVWRNGVRKFTRGEGLANDEWDRIKPEVLKVLARAASKAAQEDFEEKQRQQQRALRKRYDSLLNGADDRARPYIPLFADFLLLPTVKSLWQAGIDVTDADWKDAQATVQGDLDEYRLDLCLKVRRLVLSVTQGDGSASDEDDGADIDSITDDFFARADSFVCCSVAKCPGKQGSRCYWWRPRSSHSKDPRNDWIGPLPTVLTHLHMFHNKDQELPQRGPRATEPQLRVSLPLEVACGMAEILELHGLTDRQAELRHLDRASKLSQGYQWRNSNMTRYRFQGKKAWCDLLAWIKLEGDKLGKIGLALDPPDIDFLTRRDKKLVIKVTDDEADELVNDKSGSEDDEDDIETL